MIKRLVNLFSQEHKAVAPPHRQRIPELDELINELSQEKLLSICSKIFEKLDERGKELIFNEIFNDLKGRNGASVFEAFIYFTHFLPRVRKFFSSLKNLKVLELGSGRNLGLGTLIALNQADKYYALDIFKDPEFDDPAVFTSLKSVVEAFPGLTTEAFESVVTFKDNKVILNENRIQYFHPYQSYQVPLGDNELDIVFSFSVLEHVRDPEKTAHEMFRILKPGGIIFHGIDLRDHHDFQKPHDFLKISEGDWEERYSDINAHLYMNRKRASDFEKMFVDSGFEVEEIEIPEGYNKGYGVDEEMRNSFHKDFREYTLEDLSKIVIGINATKPE